MAGLTIRMKRLFDKDTGKTIIVPLDHSVTNGAIAGLENLQATVKTLATTGKVNALLAHKRLASCLDDPTIPPVGFILHASASTTFGNTNNKVVVATVEEALRYGADALSLHINLGEEYESTMLQELGKIVGEANTYGLPVLAMMYVRRGQETSIDTKDIQHAARVADDLGASLIKVPYTGSQETFARVVESCYAPIVIAGGENKNNPLAFFTTVQDAVYAGAKGISVGRAVFAAEYPAGMLDVLHLLVHKNIPVVKAVSLYETLCAEHKTKTLME